MEIVEAAGTAIAFPSQTVYLSDDRKEAPVPDALVAEADLRVRT
jgi:hypothetical protein